MIIATDSSHKLNFEVVWSLTIDEIDQLLKVPAQMLLLGPDKEQTDCNLQLVNIFHVYIQEAPAVIFALQSYEIIIVKFC